MAFKMKGFPIIKGAKKHSALLATTTTTPTTTSSAGSLTEAAKHYGDSMNPTVIDYTIKQTKIDFDKKKEEVSGCTDSSATNYNPQATKDDGSCEYEEPKEKKEEPEVYDTEMDPNQMNTDYATDDDLNPDKKAKEISIQANQGIGQRSDSDLHHAGSAVKRVSIKNNRGNYGRGTKNE
jgi:hypothetical protein